MCNFYQKSVNFKEKARFPPPPPHVKLQKKYKFYILKNVKITEKNVQNRSEVLV